MDYEKVFPIHFNTVRIFRIVFLWLLNGLCLPVKSNESVTVNTDYGALRGRSRTLDGGRVNRFLGVPYARPPVGNLRFKPPQSPTRWTQTRDATGKTLFSI